VDAPQIIKELREEEKKGFLRSGNDVTKEKKTEESLKVNEEKYSKLFMENPNPILLTKLCSGEIIEVNNT